MFWGLYRGPPVLGNCHTPQHVLVLLQEHYHQKAGGVVVAGFGG